MYRNSLPSIILACALAATAFGCNDQLPTDNSDHEIMPLKVGNRWIGRDVVITEDEMIGTSSTVVEDEDTIEIASQKNVQGRTWYRVSDHPLLCADGPRWMRNGANGLHADSIDCQCGGLRMKYPAQVGDTFGTFPRALVLLPGNQTPVEQVVAYKVLATDSVITVPAGTFSCYVYTLDLVSPVEAQLATRPPVEFYAPDVGLVRIDWKRNLANNTTVYWRWELVSTNVR